MGNQNYNNQNYNNGSQHKDAPLDAENLRNLTLKTPVAKMAYKGTVWDTKLSEIAATVEESIYSSSGIQELISVAFVPDYNRAKGNLDDNTACFALFDPSRTAGSGSSNIWTLTNSRRGNLMVDPGQFSGIGGRFGASAHFCSEMMPIVADRSIISTNDSYFIKIDDFEDTMGFGDGRERYLPLVELDVMRVFALAFGVGDDYINFSILSAKPDGDGDYFISLLKFIDPSKGRNSGRRSGHIDSKALASCLGKNVGRNRNHGRYDDRGGNNGSGRRF